jgi:hypothetical protein
MANMSYCRFQNTLPDLIDCQEHMHDEVSKHEERARNELIATCVEILESLEYTVEAPQS